MLMNVLTHQFPAQDPISSASTLKAATLVFALMGSFSVLTIPHVVSYSSYHFPHISSLYADKIKAFQVQKMAKDMHEVSQL